MDKEVFNKLSKFIKDIRWINRRNEIGFFDYRVQAYLYIYIPKENFHVEIYANSFATDLKTGRLKNAVVLISEIKNGNIITRFANKEEKEYWTNLFNIVYELDRLRGL
jgi:hypothetical protein